MGEHSMMDGTPTHRLNDVVNDMIFTNKIDLSESPIRSVLPEPEKVTFHLSNELRTMITTAIHNFNHVISQHQLAVQAYRGYGKELIKKFKCSPDAYVQMIIQLAYYKMYGQCRPTYESASTRRFQQGRTETCRTVSEASKAWCQAMVDPFVSDNIKESLFRQAIDSHLEYISAVSDGKGVDRHLFGLKRLLQADEEVPDIYEDPAYSYSSSWYLSTSQLSSEFFNGYGWSQVIDGGFGIAYMINSNSINFNIVSKGLGCQRMSFYIDEAATELRGLLSRHNISLSKL
jgi:carnitine O-acetyltransferase